MLACMNKDFRMVLPKLTGDRGALDELGAGADNRDNLHGSLTYKLLYLMDP